MEDGSKNQIEAKIPDPERVKKAERLSGVTLEDRGRAGLFAFRWLWEKTQSYRSGSCMGTMCSRWPWSSDSYPPLCCPPVSFEVGAEA